MYYPKQIPYLLEEEFKNNIYYMEYNFKELNNFCMCIWEMKSKKYLHETLVNNILPDACIDILINFVDKTISVVGFSRDTFALELTKDVDYLGVRLKPGAFYALFNKSSLEVMDKSTPFKDIEKNYDLSKVFKFNTSYERINVFKEYLLHKISNNENRYFINLVDRLYMTPKFQSILDISFLGYTKRHIYRLFMMQYGVSPKVLFNILRLHLCLTLILDEQRDLIDIANICGFYDQSHFIKEIKKYTGISPLQLINNYQK